MQLLHQRGLQVAKPQPHAVVHLAIAYIIMQLLHHQPKRGYEVASLRCTGKEVAVSIGALAGCISKPLHLKLGLSVLQELRTANKANKGTSAGAVALQ